MALRAKVKSRAVAVVAPDPWAELRAEGVPEQALIDWKTVRTKRRAPLTPTALAGFRRETTKAGLSIASAVTLCAENSWVGFKADWNWPGKEQGAVSKREQAARDRIEELTGGLAHATRPALRR